ncbi:hypothetical protein NBC122_00491 [Chryseobacterium salivictor]|uniref:Uncharacterized protein n=1 Tax=Chryseobacterium salivictor TaxID=2547600 RepID=A0A4P6ZCU3_9FLAO|nr:hypothetical protein NBC122_00491 [Chryseobacterium salivictor]
MNKKIFYYVACIYLLVKGVAALRKIIFIKDSIIISSSTESMAYKIGYVSGIVAEIIICLTLVIFIFQNFIMKKSLTERKSIEQI